MNKFSTFDEICPQKTSFDGIQVQTVKTLVIILVFQAFGVASPLHALFHTASACSVCRAFFRCLPLPSSECRDFLYISFFVTCIGLVPTICASFGLRVGALLAGPRFTKRTCFKNGVGVGV